MSLDLLEAGVLVGGDVFGGEGYGGGGATEHCVSWDEGWVGGVWRGGKVERVGEKSGAGAVDLG